MAFVGPFLVVEFGGQGLVFADWTRDHFGASVDVISEPAAKDGSESLHQSLFLVKGATRPALVQLMERLDRTHGPVESIRLDALRGQWLARMTVRGSQLQSATAAAIAQFQHRFGAPWSHFEDGVVYVRARINDDEDGERLRMQMAGFLADQKADVHVSVEEYSPHDYGVWDDLVQASLGTTR